MRLYLQLLTLLLPAVILSSCAPYYIAPLQAPQQPVAQPLPVDTSQLPPSFNPNQTVSSPEQKEIRQQQNSYITPTTPSVNVPSTPIRSYPIATRIPGKPGYVYNPYNNNPVYVDGIASGKTVRDPKDPNTDHKFKVP